MHHANEQQIQSTTPSVDITSPFTPVQIQTEQQSILSVSDIMSNDKSNLNNAHIQSHIPSPSNSNQLDLKPDQYSQIPHLPHIFGNETNDNNTNETNRYFTPIESKVSVIFSKLNYFYIIF